jgi:hypothetical protein
MVDEEPVDCDPQITYEVRQSSNGTLVRWHCTCGASSIQRWYTKQEVATAAATRHKNFRNCIGATRPGNSLDAN